MLRSTFVTIIYIACILGLLSGQASSAEPSEYPGRGDNGSVWRYASHQIVSSVKCYYKVHGRWPTSWLEVRQSGLFQADLIAVGGESIDPDDGSLDFSGDAAYFAPSGPGSSPECHSISIRRGGSRSVRRSVIETPQTYNEFMFLLADKLGQPDKWLPLRENANAKLLFGLGSQFDSGVTLFFLVKERMPKDINELLTSGLCPFDQDSLNPITGNRFTGEYIPWSVVYRPVSDTSRYLCVTDQDAKTSWHFSY